jgi:transcriptional regulator with XRE-family HTH domain
MLRKLRSELGLSLRQAADKLGISESFLSQIENRKRKPSSELIHAMAELFQCDFDELSLSIGLIPRWVEAALRETPAIAIAAAKDGFKKYG